MNKPSEKGVRLTARGAILALFAVTVLGRIGAALLAWPEVAGAAFVLACLATAVLVRKRDLLALVVSPPLVFFVATLVSELVRAFGSSSFARGLGIGMFSAMSGGAPWLFAGSVLVLGIALARGLRENVSDLRDDLRTLRRTRPKPAPAAAGPTPPPGGFAPEPEGYFEPRVYGKPASERHREQD
ncbi:DUF6542 domain-containing protein [Bailinhaonella thermotolerans]|uniref:DUF6542 domain-containing protein n=1 Tax=Bailinhaonella thermotolerans TaxID=1070861 RepID=A0A3A4B0B2_9ACTN|nr:DUF6542 domain-containing protein [Bailinhaonella thermotolerans]RJL33368.1 hypothetical protein D5H75_11285 [Bailinhaonella thermotolerans]